MHRRDIAKFTPTISLSNAHFQLFLVFNQRTLTYLVRGSIIVWLTSCLTGLDSAALFMLVNNTDVRPNPNQVLPYSDTSPYEVIDCSLLYLRWKKSIRGVINERRAFIRLTGCFFYLFNYVFAKQLVNVNDICVTEMLA